MKKEIENLIRLLPILTNDQLSSQLVKILYNHNKEKTLKLFLEVQELERKANKKEMLKLYQATQDGMHSIASFGKYILEEKTAKQAKSYAKMLFEEDNIAYTIQIMKAYFPNGNSNGASINGRWFFDKFVNILLDNKHLYKEGGKNREWAESMNHTDYIDLILTNS